MSQAAKLIGAGCATIGLAGAGVGIELCSDLLLLVSEPALEQTLFRIAILVALTEAIALFALMMAFLLLSFSDFFRRWICLCTKTPEFPDANMVKSVDTLVLGTSGLRLGGSSPSIRSFSSFFFVHIQSKPYFLQRKIVLLLRVHSSVGEQSAFNRQAVGSSPTEPTLIWMNGRVVEGISFEN